MLPWSGYGLVTQIILFFFFVDFVFFFLAEDGVRDAQEARGLGDVYKRQTHMTSFSLNYLF